MDSDAGLWSSGWESVSHSVGGLRVTDLPPSSWADWFLLFFGGPSIVRVWPQGPCVCVRGSLWLVLRPRDLFVDATDHVVRLG